MGDAIQHGNALCWHKCFVFVLFEFLYLCVSVFTNQRKVMQGSAPLCRPLVAPTITIGSGMSCLSNTNTTHSAFKYKYNRCHTDQLKTRVQYCLSKCASSLDCMFLMACARIYMICYVGWCKALVRF